jgi:prepilin-type N-terminal cleavage/methylation domain-containing protein
MVYGLNKAFTLIELMVAASIVGLIGLAVLTVFAGGLRVYERVQSYGAARADVFFALEEMEKDLRNIFPLSAIGFEGSSKKISFPAVIETLETLDDEQSVVPSVGKAVYYLEDTGAEAKLLKSEKQDYSRAAAPESAGARGQVLASVKDIEFSYYSFDEGSKAVIWKGSWSKGEGTFPKAVKVEVTFHDGSRDVRQIRTVWVPTVREAVEDAQGEGEGGGS